MTGIGETVAEPSDDCCEGDMEMAAEVCEGSVTEIGCTSSGCQMGLTAAEAEALPAPTAKATVITAARTAGKVSSMRSLSHHNLG